jgi:hypothetical protein
LVYMACEVDYARDLNANSFLISFVDFLVDVEFTEFTVEEIFTLDQLRMGVVWVPQKSNRWTAFQDLGLIVPQQAKQVHRVKLDSLPPSQLLVLGESLYGVLVLYQDEDRNATYTGQVQEATDGSNLLLKKNGGESIAYLNRLKAFYNKQKVRQEVVEQDLKLHFNQNNQKYALYWQQFTSGWRPVPKDGEFHSTQEIMQSIQAILQLNASEIAFNQDFCQTEASLDSVLVALPSWVEPRAKGQPAQELLQLAMLRTSLLKSFCRAAPATSHKPISLSSVQEDFVRDRLVGVVKGRSIVFDPQKLSQAPRINANGELEGFYSTVFCESSESVPEGNWKVSRMDALDYENICLK